MYFKDRQEAGSLLAKALKKYKGKNVVVYALPRGGVITAVEIAKFLHAPLDLIITRKIGHPYMSEYAIGAIAENGHMISTKGEIETVDKVWLEKEIEKQRFEAKRRREKYLQGKKEIQAKDKIAILVDDGIATGLTMRVGIMELKHRNPKKIVVAVPVAPKSTAVLIENEVDEFVALDIPGDSKYLGAVGAYYSEFLPVEDEEVISVMKLYEDEYKGIAREKSAGENRPYATDPVLFSLPSMQHLAKNVNFVKNFTNGKCEIKRFANGELNIKIGTGVDGKNCLVLATIAPPEDNLVSLLLACHTLKKENAQKVTAVLPYLAYSRHDKKETQKSFAIPLVGKLLSASGADALITVDIHSPSAKRLLPIPTVSISPATVFAKEIKRLALKDATIVAPDEGARERCKATAKEAGIKKEIVYLTKKRTDTGVVQGELHGTVGKQAVIVDDILDTGKTLILSCQKLVEIGVQEIYIMVTHGLFTGKEWQKLWKLKVKFIYTTDTTPMPKQATSPKIKVLSIIPLLVDELGKKQEKAL